METTSDLRRARSRIVSRHSISPAVSPLKVQQFRAAWPTATSAKCEAHPATVVHAATSVAGLVRLPSTFSPSPPPHRRGDSASDHFTNSVVFVPSVRQAPPPLLLAKVEAPASDVSTSGYPGELGRQASTYPSKPPQSLSPSVRALQGRTIEREHAEHVAAGEGAHKGIPRRPRRSRSPEQQNSGAARRPSLSPCGPWSKDRSRRSSPLQWGCHVDSRCPSPTCIAGVALRRPVAFDVAQLHAVERGISASRRNVHSRSEFVPVLGSNRECVPRPIPVIVPKVGERSGLEEWCHHQEQMRLGLRDFHVAHGDWCRSMSGSRRSPHCHRDERRRCSTGATSRAPLLASRSPSQRRQSVPKMRDSSPLSCQKATTGASEETSRAAAKGCVAWTHSSPS
eukprot:TRINITY_DN73832_c0_g1_i1.p1 TRINITY_DN73832_c0_g1~~TRINITY_DN73832_c0_g1_i1.p1  ORF type:complete len:396 (+),score=38.34 TRINITY_DN73832_c0_g1_i1:195-1382(+)